MASWFNLTLQTQQPIIEIIMPPYCAADEVVNIIIQANVPLASYQSISMTDCNGATSDLIFLYEGGKFYGQVMFDNQDGLVTFDFGEFKDEVDNVSIHITRDLQVFLSQIVMIDIDTVERDIATQITSREVSVSNLAREIECEVITW